MEIYLDFLTY